MNAALTNARHITVKATNLINNLGIFDAVYYKKLKQQITERNFWCYFFRFPHKLLQPDRGTAWRNGFNPSQLQTE